MAVAKVARVLFDEAHSEAWTIRPELARSMQPVHPADASMHQAAHALADRDFIVAPNVGARLTAPCLSSCDVLVLAHPSEPRWERTTGAGSPRLSTEELDAVEAFVLGGGGLVVLGETEQDKYGNNVNDLLARFCLALENETIQDYEHSVHAPSWILADLQDGARGREGDVLARVAAVCMYRATTVSVTGERTRVLARTHPTASNPAAPLIVAAERGLGRVIVLGDSDLFGDDCIDEFDHRSLWLNALYWVAPRSDRPSAVREPGPRRAAHRSAPVGTLDPAWAQLQDATNALAVLQAADGSLERQGDGEDAARHVEQIIGAIDRLGPRFPHQSPYLNDATADLRTWAARGFGKPDFTRALDAFHPERGRRDGAEHLVFFPMYKQNGPRERTFEALVVRVPWPEWIAQLERTRYDNPKFVPVQLLAGTRGYDSECAVLFPEMVATAERPANNFGAIFCDREAERLRRVAGAAAELLRLNLPPDAARLLQDPALSEEAYVLWDLIHDRTHSHGELPFDPFMIRQRAPYWMYALEELRCDLGAFAEAVKLERQGVAFARHVQFAILLDRLLRFPITGPRIRNYDGLGGQLLFAYLHGRGHLRWEDNQLAIDWERVAGGVEELRDEIAELYRAGIDRSKLAHWEACHDLVAQTVQPATGSRWSKASRRFPEVDDPRPYVDDVLDDEFPLSLFYATLKSKLGDVTRPGANKLAA